jgi:ribose/xylose/arabinose/galactoside ABC-type transport system permease subunit
LLKWFVYVLSAVLASIAGIIYIGDQGVAYPERLAVGYELNAIAAAVVGGCSLKGGAGTVTGTVLGVLFLRLVIDAVQKIIDVEANLYEGMIVGIVVILAVAVSRLRRR